MKKIIVSVLIISIALLTADCSASANSKANSKVSPNSSSSLSSNASSENSYSSVVSTAGSIIPVNNDLTVYNGEWENSVQKGSGSGGTYLTIKTDKKGNTSGSITTARANSSNIAQVDFKGIIKNGSLIYHFSDDGWGHSGIITFSFNDGKIICNITVTSGESSLWSIQTGTIEFIKK